MYAFKVAVSTLLVLDMGIMAYVGFNNRSGKYVAYFMLLINALSLCAIWG